MPDAQSSRPGRDSVGWRSTDDAPIGHRIRGGDAIADLNGHGTHGASTVSNRAANIADVTSTTTLSALKVCDALTRYERSAVPAPIITPPMCEEHDSSNGAVQARWRLRAEPTDFSHLSEGNRAPYIRA